jgi:hypothetical protein
VTDFQVEVSGQNDETRERTREFLLAIKDEIH